MANDSWVPLPLVYGAMGLCDTGQSYLYCNCPTLTRMPHPHPVRGYPSLHDADNIGEYTDCPVFDGLYNFCQSVSGGSIDGAVRLNHGQAGELGCS